MSLRHSPPPLSDGRGGGAGAALPQKYDSDPSERSENGARASRTKRSREPEPNDDIKDLRNEIRGLFTSLSNSVEQRFEEVKQQNTELKASLQFMSDQYDTVLEKLLTLEEERIKENKRVAVLEDKIETLERKLRASGLEVRNVPRCATTDRKFETKEEMSGLIKNLGCSVQVNIEHSDIKDIYRINHSKEAVKPIVVEFNSVLKRDEVMQAVKSFNMAKNREGRLNTGHMKLDGPARPVYVSETLTMKAQKLFHMARECAKNNGYAYCWTSKGQVYIRKGEGQALHRITAEADLEKIARLK